MLRRKYFASHSLVNKNSPENNSAELEIDTLTFFNVPLFVFLNEIQEKAVVKKKILRALYGHFDPYVFTFNLETEVVSTFISMIFE